MIATKPEPIRMICRQNDCPADGRRERERREIAFRLINGPARWQNTPSGGQSPSELAVVRRRAARERQEKRFVQANAFVRADEFALEGNRRHPHDGVGRNACRGRDRLANPTMMRIVMMTVRSKRLVNPIRTAHGRLGRPLGNVVMTATPPRLGRDLFVRHSS